jgi:hypothetical protein
LRSNEATARDWLAWLNGGQFGDPSSLFAAEAEFQRMGAQEPISGASEIGAFLARERAAYPGLQVELVEMISEGDAVAFEATVSGIGAERQDDGTPYLREGPLLVFLTVQDGRITQEHAYMSGPRQRVRPAGIDKVRYVASPSPLHPLLKLWEDTYNTDPTEMMLQCYTEDGTVEAMRPGGYPVPKEPQIAMERKSAEVFPGRSIHMKRWLSTPDVIAVEFDWQGIHRKDPTRNLHTISACYLRLRDGLIAIDHTYVPTGSA